MANKNRHNAAFVVGAVLGGLGGAAAALWKTPYTGEELRTKLAGGTPLASTGDGVDTRIVSATPGPERSFRDKVLSTVESTLAPVVGVQLGKTANESGSVTTSASKMASGETVSATGEPSGDETDGNATVTPVDEGVAPAPDESAASVEDLTKPHTSQVADIKPQGDVQPFPKLGGTEPSN